MLSSLPSSSPRKPGNPSQVAQRIIEKINSTLRSCPDQAGLARSAGDVETLSRAGRLAILLGIEGGHVIEGDPSALARFHDLGVRYLTLTWSNTNEFADSSAGQKRWGGLNPLGVQVVREMNRLGMIVDVSHASDETFWQVMKLTKKPVIASHSSCRALQNLPRNMSDEMLRAVAKNRGVVCINFYPLFLGGPQPKKGNCPVLSLCPFSSTTSSTLFEWRVSTMWASARISMESTRFPTGLDDVTRLPRITEELVKRGWKSRDIEKVLGGNLLRVLRANAE